MRFCDATTKVFLQMVNLINEESRALRFLQSESSYSQGADDHVCFCHSLIRCKDGHSPLQKILTEPCILRPFNHSALVSCEGWCSKEEIKKYMRITFVLPGTGMSGGTRVLSIYADRLHRRGHQVMVVSHPSGKRTLLSKFKSLVRGRGFPKDSEREPSFFDGLAVPHHVLESIRPVMDSDVPDADVVMATYWATAAAVAALSPRKGAKAILLQGYETSPGQWEPAIDAAWRLPLQKIVVSKWLADLARNRFDDLNVHYVPNSVDTEQFHAPARGKQNIPTVGMLYSTLHLRGIDVSLAALEQVKKHISNLRVVAFGAERVSARLPLPEWAEFHYRPPQNDLRRLYGQCDVWLCGSRQEGFHLPMLEAMACRCPIVSTRIGGPADTVEQGVNGFLVDVEDSTSLAERLLEVLRLSDAKWQRMSDAALATATRYTWEDATDLLETAFRDVICDVRRSSTE